MTTKQPQYQIELDVQGMTCPSCATHVTEALQDVAGVDEVNIPGWQFGQATLTAEPTVSETALVEAVAKAGYQATVSSQRQATAPGIPGSNGHKRDHHRWRGHWGYLC
jgi:copper chaperone CopZ